MQTVVGRVWGTVHADAAVNSSNGSANVLCRRHRNVGKGICFCGFHARAQLWPVSESGSCILTDVIPLQAKTCSNWRSGRLTISRAESRLDVLPPPASQVQELVCQTGSGIDA